MLLHKYYIKSNIWSHNIYDYERIRWYDSRKEKADGITQSTTYVPTFLFFGCCCNLWIFWSEPLAKRDGRS